MRKVKIPRHPRVREMFSRFVSDRIHSDLYVRALIGWDVPRIHLERQTHALEIQRLLNDEKYRMDQLRSWLETFKEDYLYADEVYAKLVEKDIEYLKTTPEEC